MNSEKQKARFIAQLKNSHGECTFILGWNQKEEKPALDFSVAHLTLIHWHLMEHKCSPTHFSTFP